MARRKRAAFEDEDMSDSSGGSSDEDQDNLDANEDPDVRAERELFANPYKRRRPRRGGKEDALYGVFGEDEEEPSSGRKGLGSGSRVNLSKLPTFVSGGPTKVDIDKELKDAEMKENDSSGGSSSEDQNEDDEDDALDGSKPASLRDPYAEEEDEDEGASKPASGFASMAAAAKAFSSQATAAPVDEAPSAPSRGSIGSRGGIGSKSGQGLGASSSQLPTSFGVTEGFGNRRPQRSFLRAEPTKSGAATPLSAEEARHFSKIQGSFGAKMLAKMGWEVGSGLGSTGEGIVTPIESKLRPSRAGIAHGGFKERTKQSIAEAKRRGDHVSEDEEEVKPARRKAKAKESQARETREQWKKPPKKKSVIHHRTYEEIMEAAGQDAAAAASGLGVIIDATGATPREVTSITQVSAAPWGPTSDPTRLPELRHNLRLIVELSKSELDGLAREAKALQDRRKWVQDEDARLRKAVSDEADLIQRLQKVHIIVDEINSKAKEVASQPEPTLEPFSPEVVTLIQNFSSEYERYKLDEIVVAAIAPTMRRLLAEWKPLEAPEFLTPELRKWRKALVFSPVVEPQSQVEVYGTGSKAPRVAKQTQELVMSPYESLLWNVWLPKLRSCVNNDWDPSHPQPLIQVLEAWSDILPRFIWDNLLDQLILPKLAKSISDWSPKRSSCTLHALVFPWLPHVGLRLEQVVDDARRKVKSLFRAWTSDQGVPEELMLWRKVFEPTEWENMLLKYVVPKLGATLREDFKINPKKQDMESFYWVLAWSTHLRSSIFAQLLEAEFFPKLLNILHIWLIQPSANLDEVVDWFDKWKKVFPEAVYEKPRVAHGFTAGLQLMNNAMDLGANAPRLLKKPDFKPLSAPDTGRAKKDAKTLPHAGTADVTFRSIVEDYAAQHNLLFVPTGRTHERSRLPLYKVSPNVDGKGGIAVYIQDDAVWASVDGEAEDFRAIGLEDMVLRATKAKK